jgi:hypothetical protein
MRETWGRQNIGTETLVRVKHAAFNYRRNFSQVRSKRTAGTDFVCLRSGRDSDEACGDSSDLEKQSFSSRVCVLENERGSGVTECHAQVLLA